MIVEKTMSSKLAKLHPSTKTLKYGAMASVAAASLLAANATYSQRRHNIQKDTDGKIICMRTLHDCSTHSRTEYTDDII